MTMLFRDKMLSLGLALLFLLTSFLPSKASETLNGAGSTFVYPILSKWAYDFQKVSGVKIKFQSIGSGGGIRQITERTIHFGASDMPLTPQELKSKKTFTVPCSYRGVLC
jgi:phosphate transport system substrate-binding protein